jgi:hypothetical protein
LLNIFVTSSDQEWQAEGVIWSFVLTLFFGRLENFFGKMERPAQ